jgi:crotonobetainyl-CoA:carnitine CoA-transferase CaiB-like acyl-CoA transferase
LPRVVDLPELLDDPRFTRNADRMTNRVALETALQGAFDKRPTADWLARLEASGVPAGPVLDVGEMLEHPQTLARDMVTSVQHARLGAVNTIGLPLKFSETPGSLRRGAPLLGEHTVEVLQAAGYDDGRIQDLIAHGAVLASAGE